MARLVSRGKQKMLFRLFRLVTSTFLQLNLQQNWLIAFLTRKSFTHQKKKKKKIRNTRPSRRGLSLLLLSNDGRTSASPLVLTVLHTHTHTLSSFCTLVVTTIQNGGRVENKKKEKKLLSPWYIPPQRVRSLVPVIKTTRTGELALNFQSEKKKVSPEIVFFFFLSTFDCLHPVSWTWIVFCCEFHLKFKTKN